MSNDLHVLLYFTPFNAVTSLVTSLSPSHCSQIKFSFSSTFKLSWCCRWYFSFTKCPFLFHHSKTFTFPKVWFKVHLFGKTWPIFVVVMFLALIVFTLVLYIAFCLQVHLRWKFWFGCFCCCFWRGVVLIFELFFSFLKITSPCPKFLELSPCVLRESTFAKQVFLWLLGILFLCLSVQI